MSDRRGSSRTLGVTRQCAVFERGLRRCVWCLRRLRAPRGESRGDGLAATIDHYDGDGYNHAADNCLPSCIRCNGARRWADTWAFHLGGHRQTVARAEARALAQLAAPLDYEAGRALARRWHPGRLEQIDDCRRRYRMRQAGMLPPAIDFPHAEEAA